MSTRALHGFSLITDISRRGPERMEIPVEANEAQRNALAAWLDVPAVHGLTAQLTVARVAGGVDVDGRFDASVELICGVTLEPFTQTLSGPVARRFRANASESEHLVIDPMSDDEPPEPLPAQGIDLAQILAEELALALPDFPRKPGAAFAGGDDGVAKPNPFAALAQLKKGGNPP